MDLKIYEKRYVEFISKVNGITVFDAVQSPLWIWKNLGLWKNSQQNFFLKKICLRTNFELNLIFFCFFLFKYDAVIIIKQPFSCTFDKKVVKF